MSKVILIISLFITTSFLGASDKNVKDIGLQEAIKLSKAGTYFIDIRTPIELLYEYRIYGTINIPFYFRQATPEDVFVRDDIAAAELEAGHKLSLKTAYKIKDTINPNFLKDLDQLVDGNKAEPIMIMCNSGKRSVKALDVLKKSGYTNILHVKSGLKPLIKKAYSAAIQ
jgi:rhodanese-related sulfurtransferase